MEAKQPLFIYQGGGKIEKCLDVDGSEVLVKNSSNSKTTGLKPFIVEISDDYLLWHHQFVKILPQALEA